MQALILAGGLGKRMRPLTDSLPKTLIPINGKPFLFYLMRNLQKAGFNDFIIVANYRIEMIREFLKQYGFSAVVIDQKESLGTAHAAASAENLIKGNFVVVMSDNLYSPEDLKKFKINDGMNYVGGIIHRNLERYGNLLLDGEFLEKIVEKPATKVSGLINAGLYKFTPEIFSAIRKIKISERGEYEITDAVSLLCKERKVKVIELKDYWLDMGKPEDIPAIEKFIKQNSEASLAVDKNIFRAYDIRGIYGKNLTPGIMERVGFEIGKENSQKSFVVGNDIRESGKEFAAALMRGLKASGAEVAYAGTTSFGQTLFAGWSLKKYASLFVTASHLPPEWNGLKLYYGDGEPFTEGQISSIGGNVAKNYSEKSISKTKDGFEQVDTTEEYSRFITEKFSKLKGNKLKVVLDCGNGSMCLAAPKVFKELGFEVIELYCDVDSEFPNRESELTINSTEALRKKVIGEKADFGIAFDGDGDRCIIIDDEGRFLNGNKIGIIIGRHILESAESGNKTAVVTIACSMGVEEELKALGANIMETPVGHTHVISNCKKHNAVFGMEESGHIVLPQYFWFDDAILIPLKIAEIMQKQKKKLSDIASKIKTYPFDETVFSCNDNLKFRVVENLKGKLKRRYDKINALDGIKMEFGDSWVLVRASNTFPKIRLYVEAKDAQKLQELKDKFSGILKEEIKRCTDF